MTFSTIIEKKDPMTGQVTKWNGPDIEAADWTLAAEQAQRLFHARPEGGRPAERLQIQGGNARTS
jgi:hypothetical protein